MASLPRAPIRMYMKANPAAKYPITPSSRLQFTTTEQLKNGYVMPSSNDVMLNINELMLNSADVMLNID